MSIESIVVSKSKANVIKNFLVALRSKSEGKSSLVYVFDVVDHNL